MPWFGPAQICVLEKDDPGAYCAERRSQFGCAVRLRENNQCVVFVQSGLPHDVQDRAVMQELKYCFANEASA